jgi:hypothetical protein
MIVGTHRGAHVTHLHEIDGVSVNKQVFFRLEVRFRIRTLHR